VAVSSVNCGSNPKPRAARSSFERSRSPTGRLGKIVRGFVVAISVSPRE
jgi:hypothetical protein